MLVIVVRSQSHPPGKLTCGYMIQTMQRKILREASLENGIFYMWHVFTIILRNWAQCLRRRGRSCCYHCNCSSVHPDSATLGTPLLGTGKDGTEKWARSLVTRTLQWWRQRASHLATFASDIASESRSKSQNMITNCIVYTFNIRHWLQKVHKVLFQFCHSHFQSRHLIKWQKIQYDYEKFIKTTF